MMQFWSRVLFSIFHFEYKKITGKKFGYLILIKTIELVVRNHNLYVSLVIFSVLKKCLWKLHKWLNL